MATKLAPVDRKQQILTAALGLAADVGYQNITREAIAEAIGVSPALVNLYFVVMAELRVAVMIEAVRVGNLTVIAQGIISNSSIATAADPKLKRKAIAALNA